MTKSLARRVWVWYLTAGALLAVTRGALFVWVNHRHARDIYTEADTFIGWLYPEAAAGIVWPSLAASAGTNLVWCSLFTVGSFVMTTPILLVAWLSQRGR
jgi:hypothetical protein